MDEPIRVAVTGVGGGCGQGIVKALFASGLNVEVYPVDVTPFAAGLYRGRNGGTVLPKPEEGNNIEAWRRWLVENKINAILPGSDHDLRPLARSREQWWNDHQIHVLVSQEILIAISNNKDSTAFKLKDAGLDAPVSYRDYIGECDYIEEANRFPLVIKPAFGMTSRGVHICQDLEELNFYWKRIENPVIQEYLPGDEYTCAVFNPKQGEPLFFIAKRDLYAGSTYRAEVIAPEDAPEIVDYLRKMTAALQPLGAMNVQLKLVPDRGTVAFEINARCSGSTAMRAMAGYNEPGMMLKHFVLGEPVHQPHYKTGFFFRFWEEMFLEGVTGEEISGIKQTCYSKQRLKGKIASWL